MKLLSKQIVSVVLPALVLAGCTAPAPRGAARTGSAAAAHGATTSAPGGASTSARGPATGARGATARAPSRPTSAPATATTAPAFAASAPAIAAEPASPPLRPGADSISPDILMVDNAVITVAEILYPLRSRIEKGRGGAEVRAELPRWLHDETQQQVGTLLLYAEATRGFDEEKRKAVTAYVDQQLHDRVVREFESSTAKFEKHLAHYGLTLEQYRKALERALVAQQFARDRFLPAVHVRRAELAAYYEQNRARYYHAETRELWLIDVPFAKLLPVGVSWDAATAEQRAAAQQQAREQVAKAQAALATRPFEDVAREFSRGLHAEDGGAWGAIGRPLQAPYDEVTGRIFKFTEGQVSEPRETAVSACLVRCGKIVPEQQRSFADVQEDLKADLVEQRVNELSNQHMFELARKASISSLESFLKAAFVRATEPNWPERP